ncbi:MAG: SRPBCC domain-containing protein [Cyclobacteriaceae bacterium]|nr:SRPBCC domain-containing protein [Cyclobacteriaceae bacterium]
MTNTLTLNASISINAPKSKVWMALIDPEQVKKYFFGTVLKSDWKVGSAITFSGEWEGKPYVDKGTILEIEMEKILKYNYWSSFSGTEDKPENYAVIIYSLEEKAGQTTIFISQDSIKTKEALNHSEQNWQMIMRSLKDLLEK